MLNDTKTLPPETRQRILKDAQELGYRPNAAAQAIRNGRFNAIAVLEDTNSYRSHVAAPLLATLTDVLQAAERHVLLARFSDADLGNVETLPRALTHLVADGFIVNYHGDVPVGLKAWLAREGHQAVWINRDDATDCVVPDDYQGAADLTRHFLAKGRKRIVYCDSYFTTAISPHFSRTERIRGYRDAMREAGREPLEWLDSHDDDVHLLRDRSELAPNAAIFYSSSSMIRVSAAASAYGVRIGSDLDIRHLGEWLLWHNLPGSAMEIDWPGIALAAVTMLLDKLDRPGPRPSVKVPMFLLPDNTDSQPIFIERQRQLTTAMAALINR